MAPQLVGPIVMAVVVVVGVLVGVLIGPNGHLARLADKSIDLVVRPLGPREAINAPLVVSRHERSTNSPLHSNASLSSTRVFPIWSGWWPDGHRRSSTDGQFLAIVVGALNEKRRRPLVVVVAQ